MRIFTRQEPSEEFVSYSSSLVLERPRGNKTSTKGMALIITLSDGSAKALGTLIPQGSTIKIKAAVESKIRIDSCIRLDISPQWKRDNGRDGIGRVSVSGQPIPEGQQSLHRREFRAERRQFSLNHKQNTGLIH